MSTRYRRMNQRDLRPGRIVDAQGLGEPRQRLFELMGVAVVDFENVVAGGHLSPNRRVDNDAHGIIDLIVGMVAAGPQDHRPEADPEGVQIDDETSAIRLDDVRFGALGRRV